MGAAGYAYSCPNSSMEMLVETSYKTKFLQFIKVAMAHLGLYLLVVSYLLAGAWTFARFRAFEMDYRIENAADHEHQLEKLKGIRQIYMNIAQEIGDECRISAESSDFRMKIFRTLSKISTHMEGRAYPMDPDRPAELEQLISPTWTGVPSILYALSILTTTGYLSAVPMTTLGQFVAVIYGLIGIPLMVLAAVDIGHFLSDIVLRLYWRYRAIKMRLTRLCCRPKKIPVIELMETKAISRVQTRMRSMERKKEKSADSAQGLPLSANASILLIFCMLGALVYIAAGGQRSFLEAFFVTFNLVANLTMAEMPTDLNHVVTLFYILIFVFFGLAVLSMCGKLAASELKVLFLKIHYFGRKISWRRRFRKKQMDLEITEMLKVIEMVRARSPDKAIITPEDIMQFLDEMKFDFYQSFSRREERRDTIAFMPQTIEALRFADEMDTDDFGQPKISRQIDQMIVPLL